MYMYMYVYMYVYMYMYMYVYIYIYIYIYVCMYVCMYVCNLHHIKLSGLQVRPVKVSGGFPVHLRSKHRATGLVEDSWS